MSLPIRSRGRREYRPRASSAPIFGPAPRPRAPFRPSAVRPYSEPPAHLGAAAPARLSARRRPRSSPSTASGFAPGAPRPAARVQIGMRYHFPPFGVVRRQGDRPARADRLDPGGVTVRVDESIELHDALRISPRSPEMKHTLARRAVPGHILYRGYVWRRGKDG